MRVSPSSLASRLARTVDRVYLLHGAEPLLVEESLDAVRGAARAAGFSERIRLTVDPAFDWNRLREEAHTLSLFAERRLIELRMPAGKVTEAGAAALAEAAAASADIVLVVICGKIERAQQNAKWFKAIDEAGLIVEAQPVAADRLADWIGRRVSVEGGSCSREAAARIAYFVEGNLLAAAQEIRKLVLLAGGRRIEAADVDAWVADHARFSVFALVDAALAGNSARALRMLAGLRREGSEPVLVIWALGRELRTMERLAARLAAGAGIGTAMRAERVWSSRQQAVAAALARSPRPRSWQAMLARLAAADRLLKGRVAAVEAGGPWDALERIVLCICGIRTAVERVSRSGG